MKFLCSLLLGVMLSVSVAHAQVINIGSGITAPTGSIVTRSMGDDGSVQVPLQFGFPFYGKIFTNSVMYDNGVVGFFSPGTSTTQPVGCDPAVSGYCGGNNWGSQQFSTVNNPSWNYMIAPLHTDLLPVSGSVYTTQGDATQMTYRWQNLGEYYNPSNLNTFSLQIKPSGFIGVNYEKINIGQSNVSVGLTGNLANGEYAQHYWKPAGTVINNTTNPISNWSVGETGAVDPCVINPLSSTSCPGYQAAYTTQQCTISALYDPSCPGYQAAYTTQQCAINPLFSTACAGYQTAYFEQQCSLNSLYSTNCPGYAAAYLDQQCSINPLYSTTCSGYASAYHDQQCSINPLYATTCSGYAVAYKAQQCSINALYATDCPGYAEAYKSQQCTANQLYATDCPGYAQAYFNQQCSLNGLYDRTCPNYSTAYATAEALKQSTTPVAETTNTTTTTNTTAPTAPTVDSSGEIKVAVVADSNVNNVITTTATSASPAAAATATVPLVSAPPAPTAPVVEAKVEAKQDSKNEEKNASSSSVSSTTTASNSSSSDSKPAAPTARQEIQARRQEAARAKAVESGKQLANEMGKAADMESQKQVQNVVIAAMGFTPGFDAYGKSFIPDGVGYRPYTVYNNQKNIDNRANLRMFGGTDRLHSEMVDAQYNRK
jgi:hypothetical protein